MDHFNTLVTARRNWNRHYQFVCFLGFFLRVFYFLNLYAVTCRSTPEKSILFVSGNQFKAHWSGCLAHIEAEKSLILLQSKH